MLCAWKKFPLHKEHVNSEVGHKSTLFLDFYNLIPNLKPPIPSVNLNVKSSNWGGQSRQRSQNCVFSEKL